MCTREETKIEIRAALTENNKVRDENLKKHLQDSNKEIIAYLEKRLLEVNKENQEIRNGCITRDKEVANVKKIFERHNRDFLELKRMITDNFADLKNDIQAMKPEVQGIIDFKTFIRISKNIGIWAVFIIGAFGAIYGAIIGIKEWILK